MTRRTTPEKCEAISGETPDRVGGSAPTGADMTPEEEKVITRLAWMARGVAKKDEFLLASLIREIGPESNYDDNSDEAAKALIGASNLEDEAKLCWAAVCYLRRGERMPLDLQSYVELLLIRKCTRPWNRGRGRQTNHMRDIFIVAAVQRLRSMGLDPYRNDARTEKAVSACQIVTKILNAVGIKIRERGVEEVWRKKEKILALISSPVLGQPKASKPRLRELA
jgi:hypothetical protein